MALEPARVTSKLRSLFQWLERPKAPLAPSYPPRIGLALGGGFARGVAHVGVLRAFQREGIPLHCIAGVSAGAIVAAAYASGTSVEDIGRIGCSMRFADVARWSLCRWGLVGSERMAKFLSRLLKKFQFQDMEIPLGVVATDLVSGDPVLFRDTGDVFLPIRASCSYPGLFQPIRHGDRLLVDGAMSMEVPATLARDLGATHVVSVCLPMSGPLVLPRHMLHVVNRCFQILQKRTEDSWRAVSDAVILPEVSDASWDGFQSGEQLIEQGDKAAMEVIPQLKELIARRARPTLTRLAG
jgi:NTE family protein